MLVLDFLKKKKKEKKKGHVRQITSWWRKFFKWKWKYIWERCQMLGPNSDMRNYIYICVCVCVCARVCVCEHLWECRSVSKIICLWNVEKKYLTSESSMSTMDGSWPIWQQIWSIYIERERERERKSASDRTMTELQTESPNSSNAWQVHNWVTFYTACLSLLSPQKPHHLIQQRYDTINKFLIFSLYFFFINLIN